MAPEQLALCLGVHVDAIYYAIKHQGAPHKLIGKRRCHIFRDDWLAWMRSHKKTFRDEPSIDEIPSTPTEPALHEYETA